MLRFAHILSLLYAQNLSKIPFLSYTFRSLEQVYSMTIRLKKIMKRDVKKMNSKKIISIIALTIALPVFLSGCVPTYTYNNVSYASPSQALQAANSQFQRGVQNVDVRESSIAQSIKIVTPNSNLIRQNGVSVTGNAQPVIINYVRDLQIMAYDAMVDGIRRSNIFEQVKHSTAGSTFNQKIGSNDALLVLHSPGFGKFQWLLYTDDSEARYPINHDASASFDFQLATFVDQLEQSLLNNTDLASNAPRKNRDKKVKAGTSSGTGFFINSNGYALTNHHVVDSCATITVKNKNLHGVSAVLISEDPKNDLAVIKVNKRNTSFAELRDIRNPVKQGEDITVFGYPYSGLLSSGGNFSEGIISALSGMGQDSRFYQISAPVQPGNSGGAMTDKSGRVVGIITAKLNALRVASITGDIPQNVNFALKAELAQIFLGSNGVKFTTTSSERTMGKTDLAESLQKYSFHIECE